MPIPGIGRRMLVERIGIAGVVSEDRLVRGSWSFRVVLVAVDEESGAMRELRVLARGWTCTKDLAEVLAETAARRLGTGSTAGPPVMVH